MLGHSGLDDHRRYEHRTLVRNVSLLTPELLNEINELVVKAGHALFGQEPEAPLRARADSFVVETDVHYPTDVNLLWDAMRCLIRISAQLASAFGLGLPFSYNSYETMAIREFLLPAIWCPNVAMDRRSCPRHMI